MPVIPKGDTLFLRKVMQAQQSVIKPPPKKRKSKVTVKHIGQGKPSIPEQRKTITSYNPGSREADIQELSGKKVTYKKTSPTREKSKTYTKTEWIQRTEQDKLASSERLAEAEKAKSEIDPNKMYTYIDPKTGKEKQSSGLYLITQYYDPYISQEKKHLKTSTEVWGDARDMPIGSKMVYRIDKNSYHIERDIMTEQRAEWQTLNPVQQFGKSLFVGVTEFPTTIGHFVTGGNVEGLQKKLIEKEATTWANAKLFHKGDRLPFVKDVLLSPAMTHVVYAGGISYGIGAGVGALKAVSPGLGYVTEKSIIAGGLAYTAVSMKDPKETLGAMATGLLFAIPSYKAGHTFGYGRAEAYVYAHKTYTPGSKEFIRFQSAIKVGRYLENIRSIKSKPLDFAKDIMRLDEKTATNILNYIKANPRTTVVGGSASSYAQVIGARQPRDIDLLVKDVSGAKQALGGKSHVIDIHGYELGGKAGRYYRFGFETKSPTKIEGIKYLRSGEQLFRKGVSSVQVETTYRHGTFPGFPSKGTLPVPKDIADFVTASKSQIISAKSSIFTKGFGIKAERHLNIFLKPETSPSFGKISFSSKIGVKIGKIATPAIPKAVYDGGGYINYIYPKTVLPSNYYSPIITGRHSYGLTMSLSKSYAPILSNYPKNITPVNYPLATKTTGYKTPSYPSVKIPSYPTTYAPKGYPKTPTPYKATSYPAVTPPMPFFKPEKPIISDDIAKNVKLTQLSPGRSFKTTYHYREFKIPSLDKLIGGF